MEEFLHHLRYVNLVNNGIRYISTGAGFLPSTVSLPLLTGWISIQSVQRKTQLFFSHHVLRWNLWFPPALHADESVTKCTSRQLPMDGSPLSGSVGFNWGRKAEVFWDTGWKNTILTEKTLSKCRVNAPMGRSELGEMVFLVTSKSQLEVWKFNLSI